MIRAIFFDFDGVLTPDRSGPETMAHFLSQRFGLSFEESLRVYREITKEYKIDGGKRFSQVLSEFSKAFEVPLATDTQEVFRATPRNEEMIGLVQKLYARYTTGLITDNSKERLEFLRNEWRLDAMFHAIICSADFGSEKDTPVLFNAALTAAGAVPAESIFVDNNPKNLEVPKEMGFVTYYFDEAKNDVEAFRVFLKENGIPV